MTIHQRINARANYVNRVKCYGYITSYTVLEANLNAYGVPFESDLYTYQFRKDTAKFYN